METHRGDKKPEGSTNLEIMSTSIKLFDEIYAIGFHGTLDQLIDVDFMSIPMHVEVILEEGV